MTRRRRTTTTMLMPTARAITIALCTHAGAAMAAADAYPSHPIRLLIPATRI
jgi:hypothetical protein